MRPGQPASNKNGKFEKLQAGRPTVPIVYHFFAHYRSGVNRKLLESQRYQYLFVGGRPAVEDTGIKMWQAPEHAQFLAVRNFYVGRALFQPGVVRLALRTSCKRIIFLAGAEYASTWLAAAVARLRGKQVYFWTHGWTSEDSGFKKICRVAFYRLANGLLLYGHHAKRIGLQMGFRHENLHVIYNSLDYAVQKAVRQAVRPEELCEVRRSLFGKGADNPLLICSGRLIPMRRLDLLLEAMCILKAAKCPASLLLVGDGPETDDLRARAQQGGLNVCFYGPCYDEQVLGRMFMAADLLVMPGRIGLAAMHSLAYGTPVVIHDKATDQGPEFESVIPGYNGACFAHNDSQDLARVLRRWVQACPEREGMRERCYEVIDQFYNPETQVARIEQALSGEAADDSEWQTFLASRIGVSARLECSYAATA